MLEQLAQFFMNYGIWGLFGMAFLDSFIKVTIPGIGVFVAIAWFVWKKRRQTYAK